MSFFRKNRSAPHRSDRPGNASLQVSWILPGQLALGRFPRSGESIVLQKAGIQSILTLCAESEGILPADVEQQFRCQRFILPDSNYFLKLEVTELAIVVDLMNEIITTDPPLYIHCVAGIERSPTACIAYLCAYYELELWDAMNRVKQARPQISPTEHQLKTIRELVQTLPD